MKIESVKQMVHSTLHEGCYEENDKSHKTERSSPNTLYEATSTQIEGVYKNADCDRDYTGNVRERSVTFSPHINEDFKNGGNHFEKSDTIKASNYRYEIISYIENTIIVQMFAIKPYFTVNFSHFSTKWIETVQSPSRPLKRVLC